MYLAGTCSEGQDYSDAVPNATSELTTLFAWSERLHQWQQPKECACQLVATL